jgi:hypothetical protein
MPGSLQAALAVPAGFATFASFSLANPNGVMMRWLKEGIKPSSMQLLKEAIKVEMMTDTE